MVTEPRPPKVGDDLIPDLRPRPVELWLDLLDVLKQWKQTTQFPALGDWIFASPTKLGRRGNVICCDLFP